MLAASFVHNVADIGIPVYEKILRTVVVYVVILLLMRLSGRRTAAQFNSFDLVVLLLLSNVVQNAIIGPDNSLLGGLIGATVLIVLNDGLVRLFRRNDRLDRALEGSETRLVSDGTFVEDELRHLGIRETDLDVALRRQGAEHVVQVERADLDPSGALVVDLDPDARQASVADVQRLERKLDELLASAGR